MHAVQDFRQADFSMSHHIHASYVSLLLDMPALLPLSASFLRGGNAVHA